VFDWRQDLMVQIDCAFGFSFLMVAFSGRRGVEAEKGPAPNWVIRRAAPSMEIFS